MPLKVLCVSGSMREDSASARACRLVQKAIEKHGAQARLLDLRANDLPMFSPDAKAPDPAGLKAANEAVEWADAFVLASPDYHGSMSGSMKNFLDHYWKEFAGKVFGYVCASHEKGLTAMDHMRTSVRQCYGWSLPYGVNIDPEADTGDTGDLTNAKTLERLHMLARDVVVYGEVLRKQFLADLAATDPHTFVAHYRKRR